MRVPVLIAAALVAAPTAALAKPPVPPAQAPIVVPPELSDPRLADQLGRMMGGLAHAMMNLPVGEMQAAIENRPVTDADRRRTVRDVAGPNDPYFEQRVASEAAMSGRTMQATTKAMVSALPGIMHALDGAKAEIERATANLPSPNYPQR